MKNRTHRTWLWSGLTATALLMTVGASNAFADASACANPSELTLIGDGQVKMKFCDIPAAQGVLIGSKARNFKKFQMAQFEVTQLQYKTVTGSEPWKENGKVERYVQEGNDNPAVYVSYDDAELFARVLSMFDKTATYRLPTEAEFEYAARARTKTNYYWGDEMDAKRAYFWGNTKTTGQYARKVDSCPEPILNSKHPGYCANDFGLFHMLGNVWEWTDDTYVIRYAKASTDGNVAFKGEPNYMTTLIAGSARVFRGGSWYDGAYHLRSAYRNYAEPSASYSNIGFRLVRTAK